jgi:hypothetical protein
MLTSATIVYVVMACTTKNCAPAEIMSLTDPFAHERCARDAGLGSSRVSEITFRCISRRVPVEDMEGH